MPSRRQMGRSGAHVLRRCESWSVEHTFVLCLWHVCRLVQHSGQLSLL